MKKVYLFCAAGMSTSMLAQRMQEVADQHKLPMEIKAFPIGTVGDVIEKEHPDCILIGPQSKYMFEEVNSKYGNMGIPIHVIDQAAYGMMDGEKILKTAIKLIKENK